MKRISLIYLSSYLLAGGLGFAFLPDLTLKLFFSTGQYDPIMIRVVGMFMMALSGLIGSMVYFKDYKYYPYSIVARTFIVLFLFYIYSQNGDPMFLILNGIVLLGLLPSYYVVIKEKMN